MWLQLSLETEQQEPPPGGLKRWLFPSTLDAAPDPGGSDTPEDFTDAPTQTHRTRGRRVPHPSSQSSEKGPDKGTWGKTLFFILTPSLRVWSIEAGMPWSMQWEHEVVVPIASAVRKQKEMNVGAPIALSCTLSGTPVHGTVHPHLGWWVFPSQLAHQNSLSQTCSGVCFHGNYIKVFILLDQLDTPSPAFHTKGRCIVPPSPSLIFIFLLPSM